jgi:DNA-binding transcriptional MerR regulator
MLKIGDFSTLSRISIHMLRHYNEIGLLIPHHVDEFTGYRYYSEDQLPAAKRIQALKDMGLSLAMIKEILTEYDDTERLKRYLKLQTSQKKEEIAAMQKQILLLETAVKNLDRGSSMTNISIALKEIPKRDVLSFRGTIPSYDREGMLWEKLALETASQNIQYTIPCYNIAIFHDEGYMEHGIDVEVQRSVAGTYQDTEKIHFKTVEPITAATLTFKGTYDWLREANEVIANWIYNNNYEFDKPMFNIYHISPETEHNPKNMITEVCFPIKKK